MGKEITKIDIKAEKIMVSHVEPAMYFWKFDGDIAIAATENLSPTKELNAVQVKYKIIQHRYPNQPTQYCAYRSEDWEKVLPYLTYLETDTRYYRQAADALDNTLKILRNKWYVKLGKKINKFVRILKCQTSKTN